MNRVLIVAAERRTGEFFQQLLGQEGFQTAVVWNPIQMVEFCRQHTPDFVVVDLDLAELGLWSGVQALREIGSLAAVPFFGLISAENPPLRAKARSAGLSAVVSSVGRGEELVAALRAGTSVAADIPGVEEPEDGVSGNDPALARLREIGQEMVQIAGRLGLRLDEYGEEGPELFAFIESSSAAIRDKLRGLSDYSLHDKDLRHDFRNMIGSVTGFAELILMEPGLSPESTEGLTRLRKLSREFVDLLDLQKSEARA